MAKAYDRVKNTDNRADVFIKTEYWTNEVEDRFAEWCEAYGTNTLEELVNLFLEEEVAVSFKALDGSICCTLAHQPSKDSNQPYLLTGWSDDSFGALKVAQFKLKMMLKGIWAAPELRPAPRRR